MPRTAPSSLSCVHAARSSAGLLALALLGAALSYPAVARATFYVKASSAVSAPPGSMIQQNTDWLPGVRDTSLQGSVDGVTTYGAVNHAAGDCRARLGHLVGHASGQTTDDYSPSWCYSTAEGVDFMDHLRVSSNTLPAGTPVTVRLTLSGSPVVGYAGGLAIAYSSFGLAASYIGSTSAEATVSWQGSSSSAAVPFDFATTVGSSFELVGSLRASVQGYHLGSSAASGECLYYADALTPGAFLVSESCTRLRQHAGGQVRERARRPGRARGLRRLVQRRIRTARSLCVPVAPQRRGDCRRRCDQRGNAGDALRESGAGCGHG